MIVVKQTDDVARFVWVQAEGVTVLQTLEIEGGTILIHLKDTQSDR